MDFEDFKKILVEDIKNELEHRGRTNMEVSSVHVEKLNESYDAATVKEKDSHIGVNVNLNRLFDQYKANEITVTEAIFHAADIAENGLKDTPQFDVNSIADYSQMKDKLSMEVVSAEKNAEMLGTIPHEEMEDMAVVYRLILGENESGRGTVLVTNNLMEQFGITQERLHADAMKNAPEIRPSEIRGMSEVMNEIAPGMAPEIAPEDEQMFVASVPDKINGAGVIAYPNFMEDAAQKLGGDFYVLPSSIHEVLLVRDNGQMTAKELEQMVKEVNSTQVSPDEQLTDHAYHYDAKAHVFEMADRFEARQAEMDAEEHGADKDSVLGDLKAKKDEAAKQSPEKHAKDVVKKSRGGEAL